MSNAVPNSLQAPVKSRTKIVAPSTNGPLGGSPSTDAGFFMCGKISGHVPLTSKNTATPVPENESDTNQTRRGQASFAFIN